MNTGTSGGGVDLVYVGTRKAMVERSGGQVSLYTYVWHVMDPDNHSEICTSKASFHWLRLP